MTEEDVVVRVLSDGECWELLRANTFGRLAFQLRGIPRIAPINYVVDEEDRIVFRTASGSKVYAVAADDHVAFEIDEVEAATARSVILEGRVHEISAYADSERIRSLRPWVPTDKPRLYAVDVGALSGREFRLRRD